MARPFLHPTTKVYYYRRVVPLDLRAAIGLTEIRRSLGTRDPNHARSLHGIMAAKVDAEFAERRLVAGTPPPAAITLTQKQIVAVAGEIYREAVASQDDEPGPVAAWDEEIAAMQRILPDTLRDPGVPRPDPGLYGWGAAPAVRKLWPMVERFLKQRDLVIDQPSRDRLCQETAKALFHARHQLRRNATGDYRADPNAQMFPPLNLASINPQKLPWSHLVDQWVAVRKPAPKTAKRWRSVMNMLAAFIERDDVLTWTNADMVAWRNFRIEAEVAPKTIAEADMAGPRSIFNWAITYKKELGLFENPMDDVHVFVPRKTKLREQGYTRKEAIAVLAATLQLPSRNSSVTGAAARRWIPWLCAYSGARVGEIAQMRAEDISCVEAPLLEGGVKNIWCMLITPEAGPVKNQVARWVPIRQHILDQGFLAYVETRAGKPLFYDPTRARGATEANRQSDKVGQRICTMVRRLPDVGMVQPNHAWRHRFRSVGRDVGLDASLMNAIDGHTAETTADAYGDYWASTLSAAIARLPRYEIPEAV